MRKRRLAALLLAFVFVIAGAVEGTPLHAIGQPGLSSPTLSGGTSPRRHVIGSIVQDVHVPGQARAVLADSRAMPAKAQPLPKTSSDVITTLTLWPSATDTGGEDFEGNWNDTTDPKNVWQLTDYSIYGGQYLWGKRSCAVYSGSWSAFAAGGGSKGANRTCVSNYPKNSNTWAVAGPLSFSDYDAGTLTYYFRGSSEWSQTYPGCDVTDNPVDDELFVGIGTDGNNFAGYVSCSNLSDRFYSNTLDLSTLQNPVLGQPAVYIALAFTSDSDSNLGTGFSVDHIVLTLHRKTLTDVVQYVPMVSRSTVVVVPTSPCPANEPADDQSSGADVITSFGQVCIASLPNGDRDWYRFTAPVGKQVTIDLTDIPATADYDIYVFDDSPTKKDVGRGINGIGQSETVSFTSSGSGGYFFRIEVPTNRTNGAPFSYKLRVSVT